MFAKRNTTNLVQGMRYVIYTRILREAQLRGVKLPLEDIGEYDESRERYCISMAVHGCRYRRCY